MMMPVERIVQINKYQNTVYEWPGDGPSILFCHATGFHGRVWDEVIRKLPGYHRVSVDFRGHGKSTKTDPPYPWDSFVHDINVIMSELDLSQVLGVGHSMGGHVITKSATSDPGKYRGLVLCDPSLFNTERYRKKETSPQLSFQHPVVRRRDSWKSPQEMYERLVKHPNFVRWEPQVLFDYCNYGLTKNMAGDFRLSCPPIVEAAMYEAYIDPSVLKEITEFRKPVRLLYARSPKAGDNYSDFGPSITRSDLKDLFPNIVAKRFENYSHFLPMENTQLVANEIEELLT